MRVGLVVAAVIAAAATFGAGRAGAEELTALGGVTDTDDHTSGSYSWGLEYRERLLSFLDLSLGYLNEGHLPDHHRDGAIAEVWGHLPLWGDRLSFALGAGPYVYFDTLTDGSTPQGYRDNHGVGVVATAAVSYALSDHWFTRLEVDQVAAPGDVSTRTVLLGVGCRLDRVMEALGRGAGEAPAAVDADLSNEIGFFFGETLINGLHADSSNTFGAEYRRRVTRHIELSASLLSDSDGTDGRHQAASGEGWLVQDFFAGRLVAGLGLGSYFSFQSYRTQDELQSARVIGLASMTVGWRFARALDLRLIWHRGFTTDDQDRDIITAGVGWRF